jgi:hypothetical protein
MKPRGAPKDTGRIQKSMEGLPEQVVHVSGGTWYHPGIHQLIQPGKTLEGTLEHLVGLAIGLEEESWEE